MRAGGTVSVSTRRDDEWLIIGLADTGAGIAAEQIDLIFDPLFTTKPGRGTGLGLTVVKQIISGHGGTIEVESPPGRGTTFRIKLPFNAELPGPAIETCLVAQPGCGNSMEMNE
jgi:signal transduction histidine kinase